jgi:hypothetical protein
MLWFVQIRVPIQPLHAAGDMRGLVRGVVENRIRSGDSGRRNQHQQQRQDAGMLPQRSEDRNGREFRGGCLTPLLLPGGHQFILANEIALPAGTAASSTKVRIRTDGARSRRYFRAKPSDRGERVQMSYLGGVGVRPCRQKNAAAGLGSRRRKVMQSVLAAKRQP